MKAALITGASSQDAFHLAKMLLIKGYDVFALQRRVAREEAETVTYLNKMFPHNYKVLEGDVTDFSSITRALRDSAPAEFYHLAAQSEVGTSFRQPLTTFEITGGGAAICLEAIREISPTTKFYFAASSEMYGDTHGGIPLNEMSAMIPRSPYAAAKLAGYHLTRIYRESYNLKAWNGILFNHEGPHRKEYFVTRKITNYVGKLTQDLHCGVRLQLGNIDSGRDWGHSRDYMKAAWMMLQSDTPDDYVVAMGTHHTVRDVLDVAFKYAGINDWTPYVKYDTSENLRPHDVTRLTGDASKVREKLGWTPMYNFERMVNEMVYCDIQRASAEARKAGYPATWFDNIPEGGIHGTN